MMMRDGRARNDLVRKAQVKSSKAGHLARCGAEGQSKAFGCPERRSRGLGERRRAGSAQESVFAG
jgi:hypothetical protein